MKKHGLRTAACLLLAGTVLTAFVALAADVGSQGDPLVTLSYLNETFLGQLLDKVDKKLAARNETLRDEMEREIARAERELMASAGGGTVTGTGGVAATYVAVTLSHGETLYGSTGTEVLLRAGTARVVAEGTSNPGVVDATGGGSVKNGAALTADHLYLMTAPRGLKADGEVTLLVRGEYALG